MSEDKDTSKLWGGRFSEATDSFVQRFTASVGFDQRMAMQDIEGSLAHAQMLQTVGVLSAGELEEIQQGLAQVRDEIASGDFTWSVELEDVHMNIEARLTELIGITGKKLHTGRSRNDQVATDIRLYLRDAIGEIAAELTRLQSGTVELAAQHSDVVMPGFTHLQTAQPVSFGHHLLAWNEMLERDYGRLVDCRARLNRSFAALLMTHLSRISEELVLWTSAQFNFIRLPDRFCTGSSIMPQKKNPDVPELVRGKVGRVNGHLISLLTLMKSQPLAYNKDNQEDKEPLFDSVDTVLDSLRAFADMIPAIEPRPEQMREAARRGFSTATDLADYLVVKGLPFRDAHEVVGKAVAHGVDTGCDLAEMDLATLQGFSADIGQDVFDVLTLEGSLAARDHLGGTAPGQVLSAAERARARLQER
jgi:argininosuccinate lyase